MWVTRALHPVVSMPGQGKWAGRQSSGPLKGKEPTVAIRWQLRGSVGPRTKEVLGEG